MWEPDWTRRDRTLLCIMSPNSYASQEALARSIFPSSRVIDWRTEFLNTLRPTQKRLDLSVDSEIKRLAKIGDSEKRIFSIINTEYMLAGFTPEKRDQFWLALKGDFPHSKGILIFSVLAAKDLMPHKLTLEDWLRGGRLLDASEIQAGTGMSISSEY